MKKESKSEDNNLVLFPSSKSYPIFDEESLVDPLQELLDEFSDMEIDLDESYDDIEFHGLEDGSPELSALIERGQTNLLVEKVNLLKETQQRIKYLLDEIELYLPRK